jgi:hypothetical protein
MHKFAGVESKAKKEGLKMSSKVLETWLNETLQDAEHLDIPGVILKPEHRIPLSRYGIERNCFLEAGIPNEFVDRIYTNGLSSSCQRRCTRRHAYLYA